MALHVGDVVAVTDPVDGDTEVHRGHHVRVDRMPISAHSELHRGTCWRVECSAPRYVAFWPEEVTKVGGSDA